jgi:aryl-alcohol dehydrogenase-like predicted oxidoreductase
MKTRLIPHTTLEASVLCLGTAEFGSAVDHRDDPGTPVDEIVLMLEDFRKAGKIRYAGLSNFTEARAEAARAASEKLHERNRARLSVGPTVSDFPDHRSKEND